MKECFVICFPFGTGVSRIVEGEMFLRSELLVDDSGTNDIRMTQV